MEQERVGKTNISLEFAIGLSVPDWHSVDVGAQNPGRDVCFAIFLSIFNPTKTDWPGNKEPCEKFSSLRSPTRRARSPQASRQEGEPTGSALGDAKPSTILLMAHRIPGPASSHQ